ncbi:TolC family outer membrane protein [Colwellia sp. C1TZA3]|uniref:TolC family outer membrane protein n=1 Tax=Colwellia sp. C1TZA3 TaxID=2508879 RepID=UPI0011BA3986|nr:TolC family outer membrane protein [Colwellia sp. C1TZA3]TWX65025.1 TolC family outer membrane protein [Colwellia sp. C1TZA3]
MKRCKLRLVQKKVIVLLSASMFVPMLANAQSLEQAIAYSLDTHPDIRTAYAQFKVVETQVEQAEAGYFPTIDLTAGIGYEYTDSPSTRSSTADTETLNRRELGLSLKQNLFSGFHTSSEVSRASSSTIAEQWRLYSKAEDVALEVSRVYVDLIKNEQLVGLSEKNLVSHQKIYEQIKLRTESGLGSSADLSQINGRLASAQSNLIAAKNNYLDSKAMFYRVIAQRPDNLVIPYPDSALFPENKNAGLKKALKNNAVIKAAANDISAANYQYTSAKSTFYPKVSFVIEANSDNNLDGIQSSAFDSNGESNQVLAMVRFSYNIFSGGKDKAHAKESAYKVNQAKDLNVSAHRQVEEGYMLSWNAFEQLNLQKKYIKMHVIAAKETQSNYQQQFRIGQRSLLDLLDTENELYQSRIDFLGVEMTEITAQYRVLHAMGLLLDSLRVTRPSSWQGEK